MRRRAVLLPLLLAAHLAVLGIALRPVATEAEHHRATMAVVEVAAPPQPTLLSPAPVEVVIATDVAAPVVETATPTVGSAAGDCTLTDQIQTALRDSTATLPAISRFPVSSRSVGNALMIWDGHWTNGLTPIQRIVVSSIRSAPPECQVAAITGPRLVFVPDGNGAAVLAFGSGAWNWAQLL